MSLHLIELKIKTALALVANAEESLRKMPRTSTVDAWCVGRELIKLRGVLREIINRPKEEGSNDR